MEIQRPDGAQVSILDRARGGKVLAQLAVPPRARGPIAVDSLNAVHSWIGRESPIVSNSPSDETLNWAFHLEDVYCSGGCVFFAMGDRWYAWNAGDVCRIPGDLYRPKLCSNASGHIIWHLRDSVKGGSVVTKFAFRNSRLSELFTRKVARERALGYDPEGCNLAADEAGNLYTLYSASSAEIQVSVARTRQYSIASSSDAALQGWVLAKIDASSAAVRKLAFFELPPLRGTEYIVGPVRGNIWLDPQGKSIFVVIGGCIYKVDL